MQYHSTDRIFATAMLSTFRTPFLNYKIYWLLVRWFSAILRAPITLWIRDKNAPKFVNAEVNFLQCFIRRSPVSLYITFFSFHLLLSLTLLSRFMCSSVERVALNSQRLYLRHSWSDFCEIQFQRNLIIAHNWLIDTQNHIVLLAHTCIRSARHRQSGTEHSAHFMVINFLKINVKFVQFRLRAVSAGH